MIALLLIPSAVYFILLTRILLFNTSTQKETPPKRTKLNFSIIIPFRNEENSLLALINSIKNLDFENSYFELLFINDHSEDHGAKIIEEELKDSKIQWKLIDLKEGNGKKDAVKLGVKEANNDIIAMTDADCIVAKYWLKRLESKYVESNFDLILGPIGYSNTGIFSYFQKVELAAIMSITRLSCDFNRPILANAANLSFRKEVFQEEYLLQDKTNSGDDLFLLYSLKQRKDIKIGFNNSHDSVVLTKVEKTLITFFSQRLRWASKTRYIKDKDALIFGSLTTLVNSIWFLLLILAFIKTSVAPYFLIAHLLKLSSDFSLVLANQKISRIRNPFLGSFVLSFIYPFYSLLIASFSLFLKPQWKGRRI